MGVGNPNWDSSLIVGCKGLKPGERVLVAGAGSVGVIPPEGCFPPAESLVQEVRRWVDACHPGMRVQELTPS